MQTTILLTGATGFLGTQIARQLLSHLDLSIVALVRAADDAHAAERLRREWRDWPELSAALGERVQARAGDVTRERLGLSVAAYAGLAARITHVIHAAADIRLFAPLDDLRRTNVEGTQRVLELARSASCLSRFAYISTAYVSGKNPGPVPEEELSDRFGFSSPYEQSKYETELLVRQAAAELPVSVFRPGMIVGDSRSGVTKAFNTLYYPLRLYLSGMFWAAPARPGMHVNLVPVDNVAAAVARLALDPRAAGLTFHLTPPLSDAPSMAEIASFTRGWASQEMGLELHPAWLFPLPGLERAAPLIEKLAGRELANLARLAPYFQRQSVFRRENADRLLGPYPHRWQKLLPPILAYAVRRSFWEPTQRTVYEQILFRLQSRSKTVVYHDLAGGKRTARPGAEVRSEILAAAAALRALGVTPGDRVALVGFNSTRYFAILVACGLIGAVSAPFYATCPPAEIECLLDDCVPKLFLVGAPELLRRLDEIDFAGTVVSFCRDAGPTGPSREVLSWQEFLALGNGPAEGGAPQNDPDAPAALYYTSGTTGQPRGVVYRQSQLRWLAETLASMYPWHERHRWGSYLSYLPMNHVVEGILATYSPYYVPAALDIYFLEEFGELALALKTARPTIFFSVPRFFEKVRAAVLENPLAKVYLGLPEGAPRRLLRGLLRRGLLRKAGLDGCRQMIVGSALSTPDLLGFFQDLGIEVHNAYGLTEAPLISLNRLGRNRTGTVGEPLPETEILLTPDDELRVRGPQVAAGYYENGAIQPFPGGWLATGDTGEMDAQGYLELSGRKKDVIITSYAHNVSPAPIEAGLRAIPCVAEAMLVGEGRPFCTALLWMEENTWGAASARAIEAGVAAVNARLSHPEQIKRWAVLPGSLSVENGFLTGSMKVKRQVVSSRLAEVIDALYKGEAPPGVLHAGGIRKS